MKNAEKKADHLVTQTISKPSAGEKILSHLMLFAEDVIKVPVFKCQRCGECILSHTGFVCSQRCPKRIRNGPCGGTGEDDSCEVYPERPCIWAMIYRRAALLGRLSLLKRVEKIHNWELEETSAWLNVFKGRIEPPVLFVDKKKDSNGIS